MGALTFALLFSLSGCRAAATTVTFSVFGDPAELAAYESLVDAFHDEHPDISVQLQHIPSQSDYRRRLATAFAAGTPPDVFLLNYRRFAPFAAQGGLVPLGPILDGSAQISRDDFFPIATDSFVWEGQLWCVPQNVSSLVVYINQDLFAEAGVSLPRDSWTWDEFVAAGRALTRDVDGDGRPDQYGAGIAPNLFRLAPFIWQAGEDVVDNPTAPTRLTLGDPEVLAVFDRFISLQTVEKIVPDAAAEAAIPSENRWLNGTMGMFFNSRRGVPTYRTIDDFSWDVVRLPQSGAQWEGILHSDAYCLSAAAPHQDAAWTFIEFSNSQIGQTIVARSGRTVPSRPDVASSPAFFDGRPPASADVFIETIGQLGRVPIYERWTPIEEIVGKEIERAFYGQVTTAEAAEAANDLAAPYFAP